MDNTLVPIAITLWMGGLVVAIYSHLQKKDKRRRAEMKKAAVRWEPAEMKAYDNAILREKLQDEATMRGQRLSQEDVMFSLGVALAAGYCEHCPTFGHCSVCGQDHPWTNRI